jgi:hypothetical protein
MGVRSTQPVTEMNTRNLPGVKGRLAHRANNFAAICEEIEYKIWESHLRKLRASTAC